MDLNTYSPLIVSLCQFKCVNKFNFLFVGPYKLGCVIFCQKHPNMPAENFYCVSGCTDQPQKFSMIAQLLHGHKGAYGPQKGSKGQDGVMEVVNGQTVLPRNTTISDNYLHVH